MIDIKADLKNYLKQFSFAPVIRLPKDFEVYDFTQGYDENRPRQSQYGIGRYNEVRAGMYDQELFQGIRNIHVGIDIAAPVSEQVCAFYDGEIFLFQDNDQKGDYGPTIISRHLLNDLTLYALHGHLSRESLIGKSVGQKIKKGEAFARVGDRHENGGWNPHLHFQLCLEEPKTADLPGVVSREDLSDALKRFPDPRYVLGDLY